MAAANRKLRILIADDEPLIRKFLNVALTQEGHQVDLCPDGAAALKRIGEFPFGLLLTDLVMPAKSGVEVIRELRAGGNEIPIVLMSSLASEEALESIPAAGRVVFLQKPFAVKELLRAIEEALAVEASGSAP